MKLSIIHSHLSDLKKEYYAIGRTLEFEEWLTAQCITLLRDRDECREQLSVARASNEVIRVPIEQIHALAEDNESLRRKLDIVIKAVSASKHELGNMVAWCHIEDAMREIKADFLK